MHMPLSDDDSSLPTNPIDRLKFIEREQKRLRRLADATLQEIGKKVGTQPDAEYGIYTRRVEQALYTARPHGKRASELRQHIRVRWGLEISPNTLSVVLARLKDRGRAQLVGRKWLPPEYADPPGIDIRREAALAALEEEDV